MYPFDRFAEDAKEALRLAQEEAEVAHHSYIGTEHLLIAVLRVGSGTGYRVLSSLGVTLEAVRAAVALAIGRSERILIQQIIPTSRVKHVIELSFDEARRMGDPAVDTGHMLLALVIEGEGIAAHVLEDLGGSAEKVIAAVESARAAAPSGRGKFGRPHAAGKLIEPQRFREVMASFPSGVVVLTAFGDDGRPRGLTVSAFCAVSLEPPMALACIDKSSNTLPAVQHTGGFTANILAAGRERLARHMATKATDKFDSLKWRPPGSPIGGPILEDDAAAFAVCTLRETIEGGDHWVLIGLVTEGDHREGVPPLVFSRRGYFDL